MSFKNKAWWLILSNAFETSNVHMLTVELLLI